jgi:hypothetical protein
MLIPIAHNLEKEVFGFAILGDVHNPRFVVRSRQRELGDVEDVIWGHIIDRHYHSLLFMRTNKMLAFCSCIGKKKTPAAEG